MLAAEARGEGPDAAPPACADLLRLQAQVWAAALDQDGAEPRETTQLRMRFVRLGVPVRMGWSLSRGCCCPRSPRSGSGSIDAVCSPRIDPDAPVQFRPTNDYEPAVPTETRTRAQQQHDALATALFVAASSELLPTIGGAAPTLVVSARADDADRGHRVGRTSKGCDEPVGIAAALHAGCAGSGAAGADRRATTAGSSPSAPKNASSTAGNAARSRSATAAASSPAAGSPPRGVKSIMSSNTPTAARPTPTTVCMLCWFHHRFLDLHGWQIRMNHGVPEVRAPLWFDPTRQWRAVTKSKPRLHDLVHRQYSLTWYLAARTRPHYCEH